MTVLIPGELNVDLVLQNAATFPKPGQETLVQGVSLTLGSSSALCAAGLVKLGEKVRFRGIVGRDDWGDLCLRSLQTLGVDCDGISRHDRLQTGITVSISSPHDRALVTYLGAIEALTADDVTDDLMRSAEHLHVSSYFLQHGLRPGLKKLFERAKAAGLSTSLDPGFDPEENWDKGLRDALAVTDVFLPNETELAAISGNEDPGDALRVLDNGHTLIAAKLGAAGAMAVYRGEIVAVPAFAVQALDTTGAGDSFNAGFLHAWLNRRELRDCLLFASACGALSTKALGGTAGQPSEAEAMQFMRSRDVVK